MLCQVVSPVFVGRERGLADLTEAFEQARKGTAVTRPLAARRVPAGHA